MNLLSVVLNSSFICPIWSHTNAHVRVHTHRLTLFGQGQTSGIVSQGKQAGDNRSLYSLSDCSHTRARAETSMYAQAHFHHPFSSAVVRDLDHTQTNRLVLQGKKVPTPHTHTHTFIAWPT